MTDRGKQTSTTGYWLLALTVLTVAVYSPLLWARFTGWDDRADVADNARLQPPTLENLAWYWTHSARDLYIPVTYTAWSAVAMVAQPPADHPGIFHAANILVHLWSVLIVFLLLRRAIGNATAAAIGAALFAVHPMQVESVGWISGMKDLLAGALGLTAVWLYLQHGRKRYLLATLLYAFALLSKPSSVTIPLIAAGLDRFVTHRPWKKLAAEMVPWLALSLAAIGLARLSQPAQFAALSVHWFVRPLVAGDALAFYLYKLVLPIHLGIDYGRSPQSCSWWTCIISGVVLTLVWLSRKKVPALPCAAWIFFAGLLPVLGFVPFDYQVVSTVTDHYVYTAMFGIALALAYVIRGRWQWAGGLLIAAWACCSVLQTQTWKDGENLFSNAIAVNPTSWVGHCGLAEIALGRGDPQTAREQAQAAVKYAPDQPQGYNLLGQADEALGDPLNAEVAYRQAIDRCPADPVAYANLAALKGSSGDPAAAIPLYEKALELRPDYPQARIGLISARRALAASGR